MPTQFGNIIGKSPPMRKVYRQIEKVAGFDIPVLITGETGTGKDMAAKEIHRTGNRSDELFLPVNMGAIPIELIASTLFGHEKGAFTGAVKARQGLFETVKNGTLFLDEIGTMDHQTQVSLLRIIEDKKVRRVGGSTFYPANARLITATNSDLIMAIKEGSFREDLYYRLNVFTIKIPPLRKRGNDIILLAEYFAEKYAAKFRKEYKGLTIDARNLLLNHLWPGNVRELENTIIRAVVSMSNAFLTPELILSEEHYANQETESDNILHVGMTLEDAEIQLIRMTMEKAEGNKKEAAKILGISRKSIYNKIQKYQL